MMKRFKYTYLILLAAVATLTACTADSAEENTNGNGQTVSMAQVHLRLSAAAPGNGGTTRAYSDDAATTDEMMNVWTVVAVHADGTGKVAFIHAACPATADREIDDLVNLPTGKYDFYSFANMSPKVVCELMGISGFAKGDEVTRGDNDGSGNGDPTNGNEGEDVKDYRSDASGDPFVNDNQTATDDNVYNISFTTGATVNADAIAAKDVGIDGNGFNNLTTVNVFGAKGIPMSNKQSIDITGNTSVDLVVVRMFAKVELRLYNETGNDIKVKSATMSDLTLNKNNNIKMLPDLTYHDDMAAHHGDIKPRLGATTYRGDYTCTPATAVTVASAKTYASGNYETITFYVNESAKPQNAYEHFFLTLELDKGAGNPSEYRYALIDDNGATTADNGKWQYIARNDYRIIPIVLDDYVLDVVPYDFPPIGVYPASVKEEDGLFTINFHDYGHFHLLPTVKKMSTGKVVDFNGGTPKKDGTVTWGLYSNEWTDSWSSWTDHTKTTAYENESAGTAFYRTGYDSWIPVDGDEAGGEPKWYANDGTDSKPQWDPAGGSDYRPFILGYIADPEGSLGTDRKVYHELKIQLYDGTNTTARREMLARIYMILDTQQMLYAPAHSALAPRRPHGH